MIGRQYTNNVNHVNTETGICKFRFEKSIFRPEADGAFFTTDYSEILIVFGLIILHKLNLKKCVLNFSTHISL